MPEPEPAVVTLEPATTAVIRRVVPMDRLPEFFDSSFGALAAAVTGQGAGVAGPAFALYHGLPTDTVDLEVGFPTQRAVRADGDVVASALPGGRVARAVHAGSFDGLGAGLGAVAQLDRRPGSDGGGDLLGGVPDPADAGHGSRRPADRAQLAGRVSR